MFDNVNGGRKKYIKLCCLLSKIINTIKGLGKWLKEKVWFIY